MKIVSQRFLFFVFSTLCSVVVFAQETLPEPCGDPPLQPCALPQDGPGPPPPVGLPIDQGLFVLLLIALLFGIYVIYSFRKKLKASV